MVDIFVPPGEVDIIEAVCSLPAESMISKPVDRQTVGQSTKLYNDKTPIQGYTKKGERGLVFELDGPMHFESYLNRPMGPGTMKHRHLAGLGYAVVSFANYQLNDTKENKIKKLLEAITAALT